MRALLLSVCTFVAGLALGWCLGIASGSLRGSVTRCHDGHVSIVREGEALVVRCTP